MLLSTQDADKFKYIKITRTRHSGNIKRSVYIKNLKDGRKLSVSLFNGYYKIKILLSYGGFPRSLEKITEKEFNEIFDQAYKIDEEKLESFKVLRNNM